MKKEILNYESSESFIGPYSYMLKYSIYKADQKSDSYEYVKQEIGIGKKVINKRNEVVNKIIEKNIVDQFVERVICIDDDISKTVCDGPTNYLCIHFVDKKIELSWSVLKNEYEFIDDMINVMFDI
jgi:hypothetical protein